MPITAKVKSTGEFFHATGVIGVDGVQRDAFAPIEPTKLYKGSLFLGSLVGQSQYIEFSDVSHREVPGTDLVEETGDIRLVPFR